MEPSKELLRELQGLRACSVKKPNDQQAVILFDEDGCITTVSCSGGFARDPLTLEKVQYAHKGQEYFVEVLFVGDRKGAAKVTSNWPKTARAKAIMGQREERKGEKDGYLNVTAQEASAKKRKIPVSRTSTTKIRPKISKDINILDVYGSACESVGEGVSAFTGEGVSAFMGEGVSAFTGEGVSAFMGEGVSAFTGEGVSAFTGEGVSAFTGEGVSAFMGEGVSAFMGEGVSVSLDESVQASISESVFMGESVSASMGEGVSASMGESVRVSMGESVSTSMDESVSVAMGENFRESLGDSASKSMGESAHELERENVSTPLGENVMDAERIDFFYDFLVTDHGQTTPDLTKETTDKQTTNETNGTDHQATKTRDYMTFLDQPMQDKLKHQVADFLQTGKVSVDMVQPPQVAPCCHHCYQVRDDLDRIEKKIDKLLAILSCPQIPSTPAPVIPVENIIVGVDGISENAICARSPVTETASVTTHTHINLPLPTTVKIGRKKVNMDVGCYKKDLLVTEDACAIPPAVTAAVMEKSYELSNFASNLVLSIFESHELNGRCVDTSKTRQGLSPRRKNAVQHCCMDVFGVPSAERDFKWRHVCKPSINKKLRTVFRNMSSLSADETETEQ